MKMTMGFATTTRTGRAVRDGAITAPVPVRPAIIAAADMAIMQVVEEEVIITAGKQDHDGEQHGK